MNFSTEVSHISIHIVMETDNKYMIKSDFSQFKRLAITVNTSIVYV